MTFLSSIAVKFDEWLVPEWRKALKLFSVQFMLITGLLLEAAQSALPPEVQALIPQPYGRIVVGIWTLLGLFGRLKSQQPAPPSV
jgi:hypothetical protein